MGYAINSKGKVKCTEEASIKQEGCKLEEQTSLLLALNCSLVLHLPHLNLLPTLSLTVSSRASLGRKRISITLLALTIILLSLLLHTRSHTQVWRRPDLRLHRNVRSQALAISSVLGLKIDMRRSERRDRGRGSDGLGAVVIGVAWSRAGEGREKGGTEGGEEGVVGGGGGGRAAVVGDGGGCKGVLAGCVAVTVFVSITIDQK